MKIKPYNQLSYEFKLPPEEEVILRNQHITNYYARLYKSEPKLFKWAGMAAFASFHIGEKLNMWDWEDNGIKTFAETCKKKNNSIEDDFQVIRIINNRIFKEIGSMHLAFLQLDYKTFQQELEAAKKHDIIKDAFRKLNAARTEEKSEVAERLIWEANTEILLHEQRFVVQPMFDKLTRSFSSVMSLIASFDYRVNHKSTNWKFSSRFLSFILFKGFSTLMKTGYLPSAINFDQRWFWIKEDLIEKWKKIEQNTNLIEDELNYLTHLQDKPFVLSKPKGS